MQINVYHCKSFAYAVLNRLVRMPKQLARANGVQLVVSEKEPTGLERISLGCCRFPLLCFALEILGQLAMLRSGFSIVYTCTTHFQVH